jgi:hypothetical protein
VVPAHAKDDAAQRFYMNCAEFIEYTADSRTLFLPSKRGRGLQLSFGRGMRGEAERRQHETNNPLHPEVVIRLGFESVCPTELPKDDDP